MTDTICSSDGSNRQKQCRSQKRLDRSKSREISASWHFCPSRSLSTLFRTSQHRSFSRNTLHSNNTRLSTVSSSPDTQTNTPSSFNPSPEKRTATAFYVRLDRKPQVLRYVHRISPLRQAQTNCLPASTRSLGCLLPSHPAYVQPMRWCLHQVFTMFAGRESDLTPDRRRHA